MSECCLLSSRRQLMLAGASGPRQEVLCAEMDGGNPSLPSTTSLVPLSHKAVPSGHAVITHFIALILIMANVNIRIINIHAQNNAVICNYRVALIFILSSPPYHHFSRWSSSSNLLSLTPPPSRTSILSWLQCNHATIPLGADLIRLLYINVWRRAGSGWILRRWFS